MSCDQVQKITEALYRVTEFFPDKEPLKWRLRSDAIEVFDFLLSSENKKEIFGIEKILNLIQGIERALRLASSFGPYMPSVNFEILRREYLALGDSLEAQMESKKQELLSLRNLLPVSIGQSTDSNGQSDDSNGQFFVDNGHPQIKKEKETQGRSLQLVAAARTGLASTNGHLPLLKERQKKILSALKGNGWVTIREISASLPEYGEKSVQRDILEMVEAGILKKTGDKRWRKYSLI